MDPERVRAYLQVACAGLGFDIGEVWWTSNENGSSTVATIGESFSLRTQFSRRGNWSVSQLVKILSFFQEQMLLE
jgi:hypothetical protein